MDVVPPVDGLTIGASLRASAARHPRREALVFPQQEVRLTYAEYDRRVDDVSRSLLSMGIKKGDHLAVWATNRPEWVLLVMAAARLGVVLVTVDPADRPQDLVFALPHSGAKALFLVDRFKNTDYFGMIVDICPELARAEPGSLEAEHSPDLRWIVSMCDEAPIGVVPWSTFMELGDDTPMDAVFARELELAPHEAIHLQYTSGVIGFPKGVVFSHRDLLINAWHAGEAQRLTCEDRVCVPVPSSHLLDAVTGILGCTVRGATMLVRDEHFEAEAVHTVV